MPLRRSVEASGRVTRERAVAPQLHSATDRPRRTSVRGYSPCLLFLTTHGRGWHIELDEGLRPTETALWWYREVASGQICLLELLSVTNNRECTLLGNILVVDRLL